jgi:hypothetical protein
MILGFPDGQPSLTDLVGNAMETIATVYHQSLLTLLDSGSMITCIAKSYVKKHLASLARYPINDILQVKGPLDECLPYKDFIELEIGLPLGESIHSIGTFPVLVSPDTDYNQRVPLLIGTNILEKFYDQVQHRVSLDETVSVQPVSKQVLVTLQTISLRRRHLDKSNGRYGLVRTRDEISLDPHQSVMVHCAA